MTELEQLRAEVEWLKLEHDYEATALDDARKAAESLAARERERAEDQTRIAAEERAQRMMAEDRVKALEGCLRELRDAAGIYAADQKDAPHPLCGNVQPISVEDGERLNTALTRADVLLTPAPSAELAPRKLCACCDSWATHVGPDGYRRCEEHRLRVPEPTALDSIRRK